MRSGSLLRIEGGKDMSKRQMEREFGSLDISLTGSKFSVNLTAISPGNWVGTAEVQDCRLCSAVSNSDCVFESARSLQDGEVEWMVVAPDALALSQLVKNLESIGCHVKIQKVSQIEETRELTEHQRRAVRLAYELGYYDIPKRINLDELAKMLNISKAALDTTLRRAQRKLIEERISEL
jgi:predicted DNA binding protein